MNTDEDKDDCGIPTPYPLEEALEAGFSRKEQPAPKSLGPVTGDDFDGEGQQVDAPLDPDDVTFMSLIPRLKPKQQRFAYALMDVLGVVSQAAFAAEVSVNTVSTWRATDEVFDFVITEIQKYCTGVKEAALIQSATVGVLQPVFQGGVRVGFKRVRDVRAMELVLKAEMPEKYGDSAGQSQGVLKQIAAEGMKAALKDTIKKLAQAAGSIAAAKQVAGRVIDIEPRK